MSEVNRRDFVKWVVYLGAVAALPAETETKELPTDVLEGLSVVSKKIADINGNADEFRLKEHAAFEHHMQEIWREANGSARYVRTVRDLGFMPAGTWPAGKMKEITKHPDSYQMIFQYRRT